MSPEAVALLGGSALFVYSMQELSKMTDLFSKASVGYERICEVLDTQSTVRDWTGARKAQKFRGDNLVNLVIFRDQLRAD